VAVSLDPRTNLRRVLVKFLQDSSYSSLDAMADDLEMTPSLLESYVFVRVLPDPSTYLRIRQALNVTHDDRGLDRWYIELLAAQEPPKRTSSIKRSHVISAGRPDPLSADTAEELVEKLREVHRWALEPSLRELQTRSGGALKRSTISDMLHPDNKTLPRFDRYALFLEACWVTDLTYWVAAWRRVAPPPRLLQVRRLEEATYARYRQGLVPALREPELYVS
jgi:hypothetical protein